MKTKRVLAIDPGIAGAFLVTDGGSLQTWPMPIIVNGKDKLIDFKKVLHLLERIRAEHGRIHVFLERAVPMAQGAKAAFTYGRGFEALLIAIGIEQFPMTLVEPNKWSKEMHEGISNDIRPKAKSLIAVRRLYPTLVDKLPTSSTGRILDGPIDALLIAGYGLRKNGAAKPEPDLIGDFF